VRLRLPSTFSSVELVEGLGRGLRQLIDRLALRRLALDAFGQLSQEGTSRSLLGWVDRNVVGVGVALLPFEIVELLLQRSNFVGQRPRFPIDENRAPVCSPLGGAWV
jgi:hypothetical protein